MANRRQVMMQFVANSCLPSRNFASGFATLPFSLVFRTYRKVRKEYRKVRKGNCSDRFAKFPGVARLETKPLWMARGIRG